MSQEHFEREKHFYNGVRKVSPILCARLRTVVSRGAVDDVREIGEQIRRISGEIIEQSETGLSNAEIIAFLARQENYAENIRTQYIKRCEEEKPYPKRIFRTMLRRKSDPTEQDLDDFKNEPLRYSSRLLGQGRKRVIGPDGTAYFR